MLLYGLIFLFFFWWLVKVFLLSNNLTSYFQMTNTIQKKFKVTSTQLLYQSCPYQAMTLFIVGPFLDGLLTNQNVFAFRYTPQVLVRIAPAPSPSPRHTLVEGSFSLFLNTAS
jgi:hypothetical protein